MSLAPEGREGLFTALASAPLFAAKLPTGVHGLVPFQLSLTLCIHRVKACQRRSKRATHQSAVTGRLRAGMPATPEARHT